MNIDKSIPTHKSNYGSSPSRQIRYIVIHYTGRNSTARQNASYYAGENCGASAHFFVGHASEGAKIYQG
ncbi:MAG: N-acetylmuramoyl-L-alanine amidase, partial [Eubacteriales bacterium]|nr:N-acetylmuramoyl-L-alanine amidase [Eubacteriales bacterium]